MVEIFQDILQQFFADLRKLGGFEAFDLNYEKLTLIPISLGLTMMILSLGYLFLMKRISEKGI